MHASRWEQQTDPCSHQQLRTDLDCVKDMLARLDDRSTRNKALYPLRGAICTFLVVIADQMGCGSWSELQSRLRLERRRGILVKPVLDALDRTLQQEGLDMATWNDLAKVGWPYDVYYGPDVKATTVLKQVENEGLVPDDLLGAKPALVKMLRFLHSEGY